MLINLAVGGGGVGGGVEGEQGFNPTQLFGNH